MSKIAIISDTHDQVANLRAVIQYCNAADIELVIHCGDLISPFMLKELAMFNGPSHLIYGNNVGDQHSIANRCAKEYPAITHHGLTGSVTIDGLKIAFVHYPEMAVGMALKGQYDIVCCGHSHKYLVREYDSSLLINPGHLLGENDEASFVILDCTNKTLQRIRVGESMFKKDIKVRPEEECSQF